MPHTPTIKIDCLDNLRGGFAIINQSDFDPEVHTPFGEGGSTTNQDTTVVIPDNWEDLHWKNKVQFAEQLTGAELVVPNGQTAAEYAVDVIQNHLAADA